MAQVDLAWDSVSFAARDVTGWVSFKKIVHLDEHQNLLSNRAVYVIRIKRPYSFQYENGHSPVAYIGKGQAKIRITNHLKAWIKELGRNIPDLKLTICFCEPRVRKLGRICEHVEADLIQRFVDRFGERPLRNRVTPKSLGKHEYIKQQLKILDPNSGPGYHWAIRPLRSSPFFRDW